MGESGLIFGAAATLLVTLALATAMAAHAGVLHLFGGIRVVQRPAFGTALLAVMAGAGGMAAWQWLDRLAAGSLRAPLPFLFKLGALALYSTGFIVYLEIRSLLSRGYSLRILVDLLRAGGSCASEALKNSYGGGKGLDGLLRRRIASLEDLRLVKSDGDRIGPITTTGMICAHLVVGMRRLLRLETVG